MCTITSVNINTAHKDPAFLTVYTALKLQGTTTCYHHMHTRCVNKIQQYVAVRMHIKMYMHTYKPSPIICMCVCTVVLLTWKSFCAWVTSVAEGREVWGSRRGTEVHLKTGCFQRSCSLSPPSCSITASFRSRQLWRFSPPCLAWNS